MSNIDIILIVPVVWGLYQGFKKGLVIQVTSFIALGLGIYGAINFSSLAVTYIRPFFDINFNYISIVAFATTFLIIVIGIHFLGKATEKVLKLVALGFFNKLLGAIFGALKITLILSALVFLVEMLNSNIQIISHETKSKSLFYEPLSKVITESIPQAKTLIEQKTEEILSDGK